MVSLCNLRSVIHAEHITSTEAAWKITVSESMYAMSSDGRQNECNYQQNIGAVFVCLFAQCTQSREPAKNTCAERNIYRLYSYVHIPQHFAPV
jgi:hypothetical protein